MTTFTLEIANTKFGVPVGKTGKVTNIDLSKIPPNVLAIALVNGFIGALNNIARSNGQGETPKTDAEWAKARADKVAVWEAGSWAATGGGERDVLPMRDAFYRERGAADATSRRALDKAIKAEVEAAFGKDESATFATFLKAVATKLAKARKQDYETLHQALVDKYTGLALELVKERQKAAATIDLGELI
jgi:hypothetical protein